jgi:hypothetical protein
MNLGNFLLANDFCVKVFYSLSSLPRSLQPALLSSQPPIFFFALCLSSLPNLPFPLFGSMFAKVTDFGVSCIMEDCSFTPMTGPFVPLKQTIQNMTSFAMFGTLGL